MVHVTFTIGAGLRETEAYELMDLKELVNWDKDKPEIHTTATVNDLHTADVSVETIIKDHVQSHRQGSPCKRKACNI